MTAKGAYRILLLKYQDLKATRCVEYDSRFVFSVVPKTFDINKSSEVLLDNLCAVIKNNGQVRDFKPFHISLEELKAGREIYDFI